MEYKLFIIPLAIMIINQGIKVIIEILKGNFSLPSILSYGGMPSSHAALVVSLATVMGYYQGMDSPEFAIAIIITLFTIRDASGIRWHLGTHGQILNKLIKELPDKQEYKFPVLNERFGHKNIEIIVGSLISLVLTMAAIMIWS
ncbi:divergent PAP2 family protein [Candidatus Parcubacteria bacterium]|jgi:uncharacterized protein|nr:divergent PAP2 family protein [Candidatus Parcubacteria bacterium]